MANFGIISFWHKIRDKQLHRQLDEFAKILPPNSQIDPDCSCSLCQKFRKLKKQTFIGTYFDLHTRKTHPVFGDPDDVPWRKQMEVEQEREVADQMFKFKVGNIVRHVAQGDPVPETKENRWLSVRGDEVRYFILERSLQQCYGGLIQKHYLCRPVLQRAAMPDRERYTFTEPELMLSEPFYTKEVTPEHTHTPPTLN
jgi:hypothetical protein